MGDEIVALIGLWLAWRGNGMTTGRLPFGGGEADQPAIVMDAFGEMESAAAKVAKKPTT